MTPPSPWWSSLLAWPSLIGIGVSILITTLFWFTVNRFIRPHFEIANELILCCVIPL
jgi:hypothetical protein